MQEININESILITALLLGGFQRDITGQIAFIIPYNTLKALTVYQTKTAQCCTNTKK